MELRAACCLALGLIAGWAAGCADEADRPEDRRPNIVLIVVDDLGWDDFGVGTAKDLRTPQIDALAADGVRFTSAYSVAPLCSPARAGLLTGRYPQRFGHENNTGSVGRQHDARIGLALSERTLADVLNGAGYATGMIGKWHLGVRQEYHPMRRGFGEFFGFLPGHHAYHQWSEKSHNPILSGFDPVRGSGYLTDAFTRQAVAFVERHAGERFFLMLAYSAVHEPLVADPARLARMTHLPEGPRRNLAAVLAAVDDGVGELMASLRRQGIEQQTLILFTSDNGAAGVAGSLRGGKASLYEGGIRIPLIARWPGRLSGGSRYAELVSSLDLFATATAAAGIHAVEDSGPLDGVDLLPHVLGDIGEAPHDTLYWRIGTKHAMRDQSWKLHWRSGGVPTLYDLSSDPGESLDLAAAEPARVDSMREAYARWEAPLVGPRWEWLPGQLGRAGASEAE
jgi:arylsulfatase A-like enzyme